CRTCQRCGDPRPSVCRRSGATVLFVGLDRSRGHGGGRSLNVFRHRLLLEALEERTGLSFLPPVSYNVSARPRSLAPADFNGDGLLDGAVVNSDSNTVSVLLGRGSGTFELAVDYAAGNDPRFVAVGDFNGDGLADLAVADNLSQNVAVLFGKGNGTFRSPVY